MQRAQRLRQVYHEAANAHYRQLSEPEWARAAGLSSPQRLAAVLRKGSAAEKRLLREHQGFLVSLVKKFAHRVGFRRLRSYFRRSWEQASEPPA